MDTDPIIVPVELDLSGFPGGVAKATKLLKAAQFPLTPVFAGGGLKRMVDQLGSALSKGAAIAPRLESGDFSRALARVPQSSRTFTLYPVIDAAASARQLRGLGGQAQKAIGEGARSVDIATRLMGRRGPTIDVSAQTMPPTGLSGRGGGRQRRLPMENSATRIESRGGGAATQIVQMTAQWNAFKVQGIRAFQEITARSKPILIELNSAIGRLAIAGGKSLAGMAGAMMKGFASASANLARSILGGLPNLTRNLFQLGLDGGRAFGQAFGRVASLAVKAITLPLPKLPSIPGGALGIPTTLQSPPNAVSIFRTTGQKAAAAFSAAFNASVSILKQSITALTGLITEAAKVGNEVDAYVRRSAGLAQTGQAGYERLLDSAIAIGARSDVSVSTKDVAIAQELFLKAGRTEAQTIAAQLGIAKLSTLTGESNERIAKNLLDFQAKFRISAEEQAKAADLFGGLITAAKMNSSDAAYSMKFLQVDGTTLQDLDSATKLLALLANAGLRGSTAGTSLTALMTRMPRLAEEMGVSLEDGNGKIRDQLQLALELRKSVRAYERVNGELATSQLLTKKLGVNGARTIKVIAMQTDEQIRALLGRVDTAGARMGVITEEALKQTGIGALAVNNSFEALQVQMNKSLAPAINAVALSISRVLGGLVTSPVWKQIDGLTSSIVASVNSPRWQSFFDKIGQNLSRGFLLAVQSVEKFFRVLKDPLDAPFVRQLQAALADIAPTFKSAKRELSAGFNNVSLLKTLETALAFTVRTVGAVVGEAGALFGRVLQTEGANRFFTGLNAMLTGIGGVFPQIAASVGQVLTAVLPPLDFLLRTLSVAFTDISRMVAGLADSVSSKLSSAFTFLSDSAGIDAIGAGLSASLSAIVALIPPLASGLGSLAGPALRGLDALAQSAGRALEYVANLAGNAAPSLGAALDKTFRSVASGTGLASLWAGVNAVGESLLKLLPSLGDLALNVVRVLAPVLNTLALGLGALLQGVSEVITALAPGVFANLNAMLRGLVGVMERAGKSDLWKGIGAGLGSAFEGVKAIARTVGQFISAIVPLMAPAFEFTLNLLGRGLELVGSFMSRVSSGLAAVPELAQGAARNITGAFTSAYARITTGLSAVASNPMWGRVMSGVGAGASKVVADLELGLVRVIDLVSRGIDTGFVERIVTSIGQHVPKLWASLTNTLGAISRLPVLTALGEGFAFVVEGALALGSAVGQVVAAILQTEGARKLVAGIGDAFVGLRLAAPGLVEIAKNLAMMLVPALGYVLELAGVTLSWLGGAIGKAGPGLQIIGYGLGQIAPVLGKILRLGVTIVSLPVVGLISAIRGVIAVVEGLGTVVGFVYGLGTNLGTALVLETRIQLNAISSFWRGLGRNVNAALAGIASYGGTVGRYLRSLFASVGSGLSNSFSGGARSAVVSGNSIRVTFANVGAGIKYQFELARFNASKSLTAIVGAVTRAVTSIRDWFKWLGSSISASLSNAFSGIVGVVNALGSRLQSFVQAVSDLGSRLTSLRLPTLGSLPRLPGFNGGGVIGRGRSPKDDQLILAQRGEGIVTHRGMDVLGAAGLAKLNYGGLPKFATGGVVGGATFSRAITASEQGVMRKGWDGVLAITKSMPALQKAIRDLVTQLPNTGTASGLAAFNRQYSEVTRAIASLPSKTSETIRGTYNAITQPLAKDLANRTVSNDALIKNIIAGSVWSGESPTRGTNEGIFSQAGIPQPLVDLLKVIEKFEGRTYLDSAGVKTIGFGSAATSGDPKVLAAINRGSITIEEANELMLGYLNKNNPKGWIASQFPNARLNDNQMSALMSLWYNGGDGIILALARKAQSTSQIAAALPSHWVNAGTSSETGLRNRRAVESKLFNAAPAAPATALPPAVISAVSAKPIVRTTRTGRKDSNGLDILQVDLVKGGVVVDTLFATSGQARNQTFEVAGKNTQKSGSMAPIPEGVYKLGTPEVTGGSFGSGLGNTWVSIDGNEALSGRSAFGFHRDANIDVAPGSAGCIVFTNQKDIDKLAGWVKGGAKDLSVDWGLGSVKPVLLPTTTPGLVAPPKGTVPDFTYTPIGTPPKITPPTGVTTGAGGALNGQGGTPYGYALDQPSPLTAKVQSDLAKEIAAAIDTSNLAGEVSGIASNGSPTKPLVFGAILGGALSAGLPSLANQTPTLEPITAPTPILTGSGSGVSTAGSSGVTTTGGTVFKFEIKSEAIGNREYVGIESVRNLETQLNSKSFLEDLARALIDRFRNDDRLRIFGGV